ncbi:MAG: DUF1559 domain-containing protein [Pirellulales bacterium]
MPARSCRPPAGRSTTRPRWSAVRTTPTITRSSRPGPYFKRPGAFFIHILPYIEETALFSLVNQPGKNMNSTFNGKIFYANVVDAYLCPSDPTPSRDVARMGNSNNYDAGWATTNYVANYLAFGDPDKNMQDGDTKIKDFTDGTSKTVVFAERYNYYGYFTSGTSTGQPASQSALWTNSESRWSPQFCRGLATSATAGWKACPLFQDGVLYTDASGPEGGGQMIHPGTMNIGMADGSVQSLNGDVDATNWSRACDRRDGQTQTAF